MTSDDTGSAAPPPAAALSGEDEDERRRREQADAQLTRRPSFSIRARILLTFSAIFFLCGAVTLWSLWAQYELEDKLLYLEAAGDYLREIQQARRFEKNYFLYGTNLDDSLEHVDGAEKIMVDRAISVERIIGADNYRTSLEHLRAYRDLLRELQSGVEAMRRESIERHLRRHGAEMVSFAGELVERERQSVDRMMQLSRRVPLFFLAALLVTMVFMGTFFARNLLRTLGRFMAYAQRIGRGDYSPIMPARKYQDEFSQLARAFNQMIRELDHRERVLVESHKLRAIGTLVAGVAHELNNPLNNVMLTAAVLEEDFDALDDGEKLQMVKDVIAEAERARGIVRNLLDFARESKTFVKPLQMADILRDSINLVANQVRLAKVRLDAQLTDNLPMVHGDEQMLKQVFVNLLLNALDVLPPHGRIGVSLKRAAEDGFVAIEVSDNGPGMPEHVLRRIFDPFFTTKTRGKGTGLGLSVSQEIVRRLGGGIRVASTPGAGTTFTVLLPTTEVPSSISTGA